MSVPVKVNYGAESAGTNVIVAQKTTITYVWNAAKGFGWGEENNIEGMVGDIASGLLIYGDVRDIIKNLCYLVPGGNETNWVDFGFACAGLVTEFAVGAGEVPDFFITVAKKMLKLLPVDSPLAKALTETVKNYGIRVYAVGVEAGTAYLRRPAQFMTSVLGVKASDLSSGIGTALSRISDFPARLDLMKNLVKSTDDIFAFGNVCLKFGDKGVDLLDSLRRLASDAARFGPEAAEKALRALVDVADEPVIIDALKNSGKLDEAIEGLAVVAKSGLSPSDISAVLKNHANILSSTYTAEKLLLDTKQLGNIPGMDDLWKMLKTGNDQAKGFRYELEGAAWLKQNGSIVSELSKRVSVAGRTDIDVVVIVGGNQVYYQFKRSTQALGYGKSGLKKTKLWVQKALGDLGKPGQYQWVKYAVPNGVNIPPKILSWFNLRKPPIDIIRVPHS